MNTRTFTYWLHKELMTARCSLLTLYEQRDRLLYIVGPGLEKEYMEKVGDFEETIIKEEIECDLLQKKKQMLQAAINRREPIDEAAINSEIDALRQKMFAEAADYHAQQEFADLTPEQSDELQEMYHEIVRNFHPQMHHDLTEAQKQLYDKAQDAYRRRDVDALKLIHEMLFYNDEGAFFFDLLLELLKAKQASGNDNASKKEENTELIVEIDYSTDYSLASVIYSSFKPTSEEAAMKEDLDRCSQTIEMIMQEMNGIKSRFPYNAADMLSKPSETESYRKELEHRCSAALLEKERLLNEIRVMLKKQEMIHE